MIVSINSSARKFLWAIFSANKRACFSFYVCCRSMATIARRLIGSQFFPSFVLYLECVKVVENFDQVPLLHDRCFGAQDFQNLSPLFVPCWLFLSHYFHSNSELKRCYFLLNCPLFHYVMLSILISIFCIQIQLSALGLNDVFHAYYCNNGQQKLKFSVIARNRQSKCP